MALSAQYIPFDRQAGESEFLEQIYPNRTDIEPLCDNTVAEGCYYVRLIRLTAELTGYNADAAFASLVCQAWHNAWIKDDWEDALPGE